jgi:hypothetical protein
MDIKMDIKIATSIAKNKSSTSEQLESAFGVDASIDRLLAKHTNSATELLEKLSHSSDKTVCRNVAANPNIPRRVLINLAQVYPKAFFKNPAISSILRNDPTIPYDFDTLKLRKILASKDCPDILGEWAYDHGDDWLQAAYIIGSVRPSNMLEKFRQSNYPQVVSALLHFDDGSYIQWAEDLGCVPSEGQNKESDFSPRDYAETLIDQLNEKCVDLSMTLVPKVGVSDSLQGEILRAISRLEGEFYRNLFMNWGNDSNYFEDLLALIHSTLIDEESFTPLVKKIVEADVEHIRFIATYDSPDSDEDASNSEYPDDDDVSDLLALMDYSNDDLEVDEDDCDAEEDGDGKPYRFNDIETMAFPRLNAVITVWCERHKEPIPYTK